MKKEWSYKGVIGNIMKYGRNSILVRNFSLVIIMMIMPFAIMIMLIKANLENVVNQEIQEVNASSLDTVSQTMDTIIDKMFSFAHYIKGDSRFNLLALASVEELQDEYEDVYGTLLRMNMLIEEYIDSVYIYLEDRGIVIYTDKSIDNKIGVETLQEMKDLTWLSSYEQCNSQGKNYLLDARVKNNRYPYLLTMVVPLGKESARGSGAIIVNANMKALNDYFGYESNDMQMFYMVGEQGQLYYSNILSLIEKNSGLPEVLDFTWKEEPKVWEKQIDSVAYMISVKESKDWKCRYVLCTSMDEYEKRISETNHFIIQMVILIFTLAIVVAYIVTIHSYVPIKRIINEIETEEKSEEEATEYSEIEDNGPLNNEVNYITNIVRQAKKQNNRFHLETRMWMNKLSKAQMIALQSQINPHYLYNSLDMINWQAVELLGQGNRVSGMISTLAEFFRLGLQQKGYLIRIEEELEHAKMYIKILEERYRGTIHVKWEVSEEILSYKTIRLTLQPLIENTIYHGLRPKRYQGNIVISGGKMDQFIYLAVIDDGVGMDREECMELNSELLSHYDEDSSHIGIRNVNQRIKIMFGDEYGVNVSPNEKEGLKVTMLLPAKIQE